MNASIADRVDPRAVPAETVVGHVPAAPSVSWGAILAGAVTAVAFGAMLNLLGAAAGAAAIDATSRASPEPGTFSIGAGIWMAAANAIALLIGGLVAARLAGTWRRADAVLHGLGVWAVSFLLAMFLVGTALSGATVAAVRGASSAATGIAGMATTAAVGGAAAAASQAEPGAISDMLQQRLLGSGDPAGASREQLASEAAAIIQRRVTEGRWVEGDRERLEQLVAAGAGIPQPEAAQRITQLENQLTEQARRAEEAARRAADAAAAATALTTFWIFAAMLLGLGAAAVGAYLGARSETEELDLRRAAARRA